SALIISRRLRGGTEIQCIPSETIGVAVHAEQTKMSHGERKSCNRAKRNLAFERSSCFVASGWETVVVTTGYSFQEPLYVTLNRRILGQEAKSGSLICVCLAVQ